MRVTRAKRHNQAQKKKNARRLVASLLVGVLSGVVSCSDEAKGPPDDEDGEMQAKSSCATSVSELACARNALEQENYEESEIQAVLRCDSADFDLEESARMESARQLVLDSCE